VFSLKINFFPSSPSSVLIPNTKDYSQSNSHVQTSNNQLKLSKMRQLISDNAPKVADQQTNSINIKTGEVKNIGSVDGTPLNVSFDPSNGMMSTSFSIPIGPIISGTTATPEQQFAANAASSHTRAQIDKAGSICNRFRFLYSVANGSMSVNQYNAIDLGQNTMSTSELLTSLGIDVNKSFSFNGNGFSLDDQGDLHALLSASPLNVNTSPIKDNPHFAAYTRLALGVPARNQLANSKSNPATNLSFTDFMQDLKQDKIINKNYSRVLPQNEVYTSEMNARLNNNKEFELQTLSVIEKAYAIGLVNSNGMLSRYDVK